MKTIALDPRVQPEVRGFGFPVLTVTNAGIRVYPDAEAVTAAWKKAMDLGEFDDALVVDSNGMARQVRRVRVLGSIGPFFGFDRFLNRSMRVAFDFAGDPQPADIDAIRKRALREWRRWGAAGVDSEYSSQYTSRIRAVPDMRSLIAVLAEQFSGRFERTR